MRTIPWGRPPQSVQQQILDQLSPEQMGLLLDWDALDICLACMADAQNEIVRLEQKLADLERDGAK